ncbi:MAG: DUF2103 domain-containing protein [Aquificaceae bacterium]
MSKHRKNKVKLEHALLDGLEEHLSILSNLRCVDSLIPGRISRQNKGRGSKGLFLKYRTRSGFKLLYKNGSSLQEVFVVCNNHDEFESMFKKVYKA